MRFHAFLFLGGIQLFGSQMWAPEAEACHWAQTVRRFPLGTAAKRVVVLEINHFRQRMSKVKGGVGWSGTARLRFLSQTGRWKKGAIALGKVSVSAKRYAADLRPMFRKAWKRAKKIKGFKSLKAPLVKFCRFSARCSGVTVGGSARGVWLRTSKQGKKQRISYPAAVLANSSLSSWLGTTSYAKASRQDRSYLATSFGISSVRTYRLGKKRLIVANLAAGGARHAWPILKRWPKKKCRSVATCIVPEQTKHHGVAFDALVVK